MLHFHSDIEYESDSDISYVGAYSSSSVEVLQGQFPSSDSIIENQRSESVASVGNEDFSDDGNDDGDGDDDGDYDVGDAGDFNFVDNIKLADQMSIRNDLQNPNIILSRLWKLDVSGCTIDQLNNVMQTLQLLDKNCNQNFPTSYYHYQKQMENMFGRAFGLNVPYCSSCLVPLDNENHCAKLYCRNNQPHPSAISNLKMLRLDWQLMDVLGDFLNERVSNGTLSHGNSVIVDIRINTDGAPVTKKRGRGIWPIAGIVQNLPVNCRYHPASLILLALWEGPSTPNLNEFVRTSIKSNLTPTMVDIQGKEILLRPKLEVFIGDTPVRSKLMNLVGHAAVDKSCPDCFQSGVRVQEFRATKMPYLPFNTEHCLLRNEASIGEMSPELQHRTNGIKPGPQVLTEFGIKVPRDFPPDILHIGYEGTAKLIYTAIASQSVLFSCQSKALVHAVLELDRRLNLG